MCKRLPTRKRLSLGIWILEQMVVGPLHRPFCHLPAPEISHNLDAETNGLCTTVARALNSHSLSLSRSADGRDICNDLSPGCFEPS